MFTQEYIEEPDNERGQSDTISVKEELRECFGKFGEIGDVYMDGQEDIRLWESSFNVHAGQCWRWNTVLPSSVGSNGV